MSDIDKLKNMLYDAEFNDWYVAVEQLEQQLKDFQDRYNGAIEQLNVQSVRLEEAENVIEFYGDVDKWFVAEHKWESASDDSCFNAYEQDDEEDIFEDGEWKYLSGGKLARQYLEKWGEK